jgi:transposase, IS5 family
MGRFAGIELLEDAIPDESTTLRLRRWPEKYKLTEKIFGLIRRPLEKWGQLLKRRAMVNATFIEAPPSTDNAQGARDSQMHEAR